MTKRYTRNPLIWLQYLCWQIEFWMMTHQPYYPRRLQTWLLTHFDDRQFIPAHMARVWDAMGMDWRAKGLRVWPWWLGEFCHGPFLRPWNRVRRFFRSRTGGRSHRCEFTDPEMGALYGHHEGAFMNRLFDQFIADISAAPEE